jgi:transcriptional regulator with XRE-family HTH domain
MSDSLLTQLSHRVQAFIAATGISQRKLAKLIKTDETHLSAFLAGKTGLSAEKSLKLLQLLNSSRSQLEMKLGRSATTAIIEHFQSSESQMKLSYGGSVAREGGGGDPVGSVTNTPTARDRANAAIDLAFLTGQRELYRSAIAAVDGTIDKITKAHPNLSSTEPARKIDDNTASRTPGPRPDRFTATPEALLAYLREDRARAEAALAIEKQIARERGLRSNAQLAELRKEKRLSV